MLKIYILYNFILIILLPLLLVYSWINKEKLGEKTLLYRFGIIPNNIKEGLASSRKRIWIHAASVGEVNAITTFVNDLKMKTADTEIIISTITATGNQAAREKLTGISKIIYLPLDFPWAAKRIMKIIKPDVFITIETEIWPNILKSAKEVGATVLMINGRISPRSFKQYQHLKPFLKKVLKYYDLISMIIPHDAERILSLGANKDNVCVNGNMKYDHLIDNVDNKKRKKLYQLFNIPINSQILIAGSTRTGEEEIILNVYKELLKKHPELLLIIAPRHIKRSKEILEISTSKSFKTIYKTELDNGKERTAEKVIIVDTIGDLFDIYSIGTIIFCGASLVPKGGQNIMEPAAWAKPVLFGPSMDDFVGARDILKQTSGCLEINDGNDLYHVVNKLLNNKELLETMGKNARKAVELNMGASEKNTEIVINYLNGGKRSGKL